MNQLPSTSELSLAILKVMKVEEVKRTLDIDNLVAEFLRIPSEYLELKRLGKRTEFGYRMAWAKQKLKASKNLENLGSGNWKRIA